MFSVWLKTVVFVVALASFFIGGFVCVVGVMSVLGIFLWQNRDYYILILKTL
jgi:hypothetical protein